MNENICWELGNVVRALKRLSVEKGSLACLGCEEKDGRCSTHGCAIIRRAIDLLMKQHKAAVPASTCREPDSNA